MDLENLRLIEEKVEQLLAKGFTLTEENEELKTEMTRLMLEVEQLKRDSQRLVADRDKLQDESGDPTRVKTARRRLRALMERLDNLA